MEPSERREVAIAALDPDIHRVATEIRVFEAGSLSFHPKAYISKTATRPRIFCIRLIQKPIGFTAKKWAMQTGFTLLAVAIAPWLCLPL